MTDSSPSARLWRDNSGTIQLLGLCPMLAVTTSVVDALGLALATLLTLLFSATAVSLLRHALPPETRLVATVMIIAGGVTFIDFALAAYLPDLHRTVGLFVPLIVTNCAILARTESFATRHPPWPALQDAWWTGLGFAWVLLSLGAIRELLGNASLFVGAERLLGESARDWHWQGEQAWVVLAILPPGAFFVLALLVVLQRALSR